ncbi:hypothetical protein VHUM_03583 [Vanrija humicola]|uniref:Structure-specific endonuclease subunit SLX4 n=1 Tax=Vanrija humicola TaxID=5417 RepID=A0A7D8ZIB8_VANHU|nr:hypothetical protein VHUM_03583 [Vanrija humicola]
MGEVSSVAPSEAGVSEDDWGADATLVWDGAVEGDYLHSDGFDHDEYSEEEPEYHDIDLIGSDDEGEQADDGAETASTPATATMPDYKSWDTAKLQKLAKQYGYRPDLSHAAMVKVATGVWLALHPPSASSPRTKGKAKPAATPQRRATKKQAAAPPDVDDADVGSTAATNAALDAQFHAMIIGDKAFWLRILRYEPISFDEMVSRANVAGIKTRGWKNRLKRFLDLKGIIYYTADPTGPRRRR